MKDKKDKGYVVYALRVSATGEPFYFGKGRPGRPKEHYTPSSRKVKSPKNEILNNFDTYYTIERDGLTNEEANAYEKELIALWGFENLTNQTRGGSGADGRIVSKETRAKLSEAMGSKHCGENNPRFGIKHSKETKEKQSEEMIGEKNPMFGKTGDKHPRHDATVRTFQHKDGHIETCTQWELYTKYNLNNSNLRSVISGRYKSTGGWSLVT